MLVGLLVFAAIAFIWAPQFVAAITPGFSQPMLDRTVELTRIMLASPILLALGAIVTATLNSERRFAASAIAPIVYNLAIIGAAVLLSDSMGVTGLALGVVAGSLGLLVVQLPALRRIGFRYAPRIDLSDDQARKVLKLMAPRVLGLSSSQITMVVMTSLATGVGLGAVTAFTIAFALYQIPMGVIGIPLGIVIFPSMSRELAVGRTGSYLELVARATRILLFVMLPIAALGIALYIPAIDLLLGYGRFDDAAEAQTGATLVPLLVGLTGHAVIGVLARAFYARQDTRTPVMAAILAVVVNTTLGFALVGQFGLPALGLAIAVAAWIEATALLIVLWRREPELDVAGMLSVGARSLVAAAAAGGVAFAVLLAVLNQAPSDKVSYLLGGGVAGLAGLLVYAAVAFALRIPELRALAAILRDVVRRRARA